MGQWGHQSEIFRHETMRASNNLKSSDRDCDGMWTVWSHLVTHCCIIIFHSQKYTPLSTSGERCPCHEHLKLSYISAVLLSWALSTRRQKHNQPVIVQTKGTLLLLMVLLADTCCFYLLTKDRPLSCNHFYKRQMMDLPRWSSGSDIYGSSDTAKEMENNWNPKRQMQTVWLLTITVRTYHQK